jgi:DNA repair ATPase RecN
MSRAALCVVALVLVGSVVGCGSSSESAATTTSATDAWADGVCSALATWRTSVDAAATNLTKAPTRAGVQSAAGQTKDATKTLTDTLSGLGKPDVQAGSEAKSTVDSLSKQLSGATDEIASATKDVSAATEMLQAVSDASGTLATMSGDVRRTVSELESLRGQGRDELKSAVEQSSACNQLQSDLETG